MNFLPKGIVGLLLAVIFSAAMSSTSSELNALGSTSTIDIYKRLFKSSKGDKHLVFVSKFLTAIWGVIAIIFAFIANQAENLIEAVNIVGSLFYGTILLCFGKTKPGSWKLRNGGNTGFQPVKKRRVQKTWQ